MGQLFDGRNGGQIQGVSVLGLKGSDAALAQHHIPVASGHDVLGGQEELLDRRGEPALEQHRLIVGADFLEELEVLHVARADLDDVRFFQEELDVPRVQDLAHHRESCLLLGLQEIIQPLTTHSLEGIGRRAGLVRASPQNGAAPGFHFMGDPHRELQLLDRAGSCHNHELFPTHLDAAHVDHGVVLLELPAHEFPRRQDGGDALHPREGDQRLVLEDPIVTDDADDRPFLPLRDVRLQSQFAEPIQDVIDLAFGGLWLQDNDHGCLLLHD